MAIRTDGLLPIILFYFYWPSISGTIELLMCCLISLFPRLKLNNGNFRIEIPASDVPLHHSSMPKDLTEHKTHSLWDSKGMPIISPQQQKVI